MDNPLLLQTRRHFFGQCGLSLGSMALLSLLGDRTARGADSKTQFINPLAPKKPHFEAKAKRVIYLFMAGGPSQLELFDNKPQLAKWEGQPLPESIRNGRRFAFIKNDAKLLGTRR